MVVDSTSSRVRNNFIFPRLVVRTDDRFGMDNNAEQRIRDN